MEDDGGLFDIQISSSDDENEEKLPRDFQSAERFNKVRREWKPKIENGEIWKSLKTDSPETTTKSKDELHAVEELYYFRKYDKALELTRSLLLGYLDDDVKKTLKVYEMRCEAKVEATRNLPDQVGASTAGENSSKTVTSIRSGQDAAVNIMAKP